MLQVADYETFSEFSIFAASGFCNELLDAFEALPVDGARAVNFYCLPVFAGWVSSILLKIIFRILKMILVHQFIAHNLGNNGGRCNGGTF
jgi:hypothetical protein